MVDDVCKFTWVITHSNLVFAQMICFAKFRHKGQFYLGVLHMIDKLCVFYMGFCTCSGMLDACFKAQAILLGFRAHCWQPVQFCIGFHTFGHGFPHFRTHVILHGLCAHDWQHVQYCTGFTHFLTCVRIVHNAWVFCMFSKRAWFYLVLSTWLTTCASLHWLWHVLCHFTCSKTCNVIWALCTLLTTCATLQRFHTCSMHFHMFTMPAVLFGLLSLVITICVSGSGLHRLPDVLARVAVWIHIR